MDYDSASNFFEINMIKDFNSQKMMTITENEVEMLKRIIINKNSSVLDAMCGYGRLANPLCEDGYVKIDGVDVGSFEFLGVNKKFNYYNENFYDFSQTYKYDFIYSLYNSYRDSLDFINFLKKCKDFLSKEGILIVDVFNKEWRDKIPNNYYKLVSKNNKIVVELFREYDANIGIENSKYVITSLGKQRIYDFSQWMVEKEELLSIVSVDWNIDYTNSYIENTRDDNQRHILILRRSK